MKTKKLIIGILIFALAMLSFAFLSKTEAASSGIGYLKITKDRTATVKYSTKHPVTQAIISGEYTATYKHQLYKDEHAKTKNVWKIVTANINNQITNTEPDLYCLRAGLGFTNEAGSAANSNAVLYNQAFDMLKDYERIKSYLAGLHSETTIFNNKANFNSVMWILDHILLEGATDKDVEKYLKEYAGYEDEDLEAAPLRENVLTRADIEVVQQLAMWYFTNSEDTNYHVENLPPLYLNIKGSAFDTSDTYMTLDDRFRDNSYGAERQAAAERLYKTLITNAKSAQVNANGLYEPERDITVYLAAEGTDGTGAAVEQPVVQVKERTDKPDIALRKYISAVNGVKLTGENSREPKVDTRNLNKVVNKTLQKTAIYNHPKRPVSVKIGDIVTYTIRVYNEGEVDAYIKQIKDYIPSWLAYVPYGGDTWETGDGGPYWDLTEGGFVGTSSANCKITGAGGELNYQNLRGKTLDEILIPAAKYNQNPAKPEDTYTLSYVDIEISCQVMEKAPYETAITNIAEVSMMTDRNGNALNDRDSETNNVEVPSSKDLPTYKDDESNKPYVPGQEDDDDFDKVIIEKPIVDLSLRKFISKVGDKVYNRAPEVDTSGLRTGASSTAIYNHTKQPVKAEIGDVVTYTIRVYNEGEVDGKVAEITDYISKNLKYVQFGGDTNGTWWTETQGTNYNIVVSGENCPIVGAGGKVATSEVGKKLKDVVIPAYDREKDILSYVDVEVHCQILRVESTTKLTNIAEITKITDRNDIVLDKDKDSTPGNVIVPPHNRYPDLPTYKDNELDKEYVPGQEDDDDFEKVYVSVPEVDLSLRKYISAIDGEKLTGNKLREPVVKTNKMDTHITTTAEYEHTKKPIMVKTGSLVTYTIRVYNEGELNGYVSEITDYLPDYLDYLPENDINKRFGWTYDSTTKQVKTTITAKENGGKLLNAYTGNGTLDYTDVEIVCKVNENALANKILTNLSQITKMHNEKGEEILKDRDSTPNGNFILPQESAKPTYKDNESNKPYVPGQEDDDDFEKICVIVPEVDLALRKYISEIDGEKLLDDNSREPVVKTIKMDTYITTTAEYEHTKKPIMVKKGSIVTYTIRVYNEGELNGYVSEITDYLPNYLDYLPENDTNKKYGWSYDSKTKQVKTTITAKENGGKLLNAYTGNGTLDYTDVEIVCKVNENALGNTILTNLAQITKMHDEKGNQLQKDRDSVPNGNFRLPEEEAKPTYKDDESNKLYVPGQEDDDDFEKVLVKPDFDLALRKFITQYGNTQVNNRYPEVIYKDDKITYKHPKDPVKVVTGDTVIYTIRVYNEGEAAGFANEITDDMPKGLEFLVDNDINKEYRWKMLDENEKETTDVTKAKYVVTDYLSEEQQKETGRDNLIKAFNKSGEINDKNPDYRDVKIAFKVTYVAKTTNEAERTIVNVAQISKDSDDDIDSEPSRNETYKPNGDNEDDIDFDNIRVQYFDLALLKWVSQTKVTIDNNTVIKDTGHTAETARNEPVVKGPEIKEKDINKVTVKFIYTIQVMNEGEIPGYATEIKDYIPEGLKFVEEDNKEWGWKAETDGTVTTEYLKNKLLKPGETAEVKIVLTWINGKDNFGEKVNLAEISKDKNDSDSPDVDSTPNNKVPGEDDIDDAPVILAIKTGSAPLYISLIASILIIFTSGIILIKKYVLE